jgi:glycosyltransferase involved in cell wall biosynthesis
LAEPVPIAFGITTLRRGGAEKALVELVTRLDSARWSARVISLTDADPGHQARLEAAGVRVLSFGLRGPLDLPRVLARWTAELRLQRPRLLQTFLFHANLLGRFAARRAGVPITVSGHRVAERRWNAHRTLDRLTASLARCHVCVSDGVRRHVARSLGLPDDRLVTIPNGVEAESIAERLGRPETAEIVPLAHPTLAFNPAQPRLLFVGRLDRQKGLDVLLQALANEDRPSVPPAPRPRLILVGDGPERQALLGRITTLGLADRVTLAGRVDDVVPWLAAAEGFVLPSRWEGMPNALLEAMAAGLPAIGTRVEGIEDLIVTDGPARTGWLVPAGDPAALAQAIAAWASDAERSARFGAAGRELARAKFSLDEVARRYQRTWETLIAGASTDFGDAGTDRKERRPK